jgi:S1-C subfamily serine protease
MFISRTVALCGALLLLHPGPPATAGTPEDSVVKVFATIRPPNPIRPWAKQDAVEVMGTGVILDGKTILTNAHIVFYAAEVFVQARDGGDKFEARVATIGPGIDLATLTVDDESFLAKRPAIPRAAKRPASNAPLTLLGFPPGGRSMAVSQGVVARVEYGPYDDTTYALRIQVTAAAGSGSSGGPAIVDGKMIGLTFRRSENAAFVIPNEEIDGYLEDVKDGRYDGKPRVMDYFQPLENESLRASLGLSRLERGIMVRKPAKADSTYPLRERDVVTHIGGVAVDNDGMVDYDGGLRLSFMALIPRLAKGGSLPIRLIREGKPHEVGLPVTRDDDRLLRPYRGQYPSYFVLGLLVFSPAIEDAVTFHARGNPAALAGSPLDTRGLERAAFPGEELVVATSPLLAHRVARGYGDPFGQAVADVDGVKIKNFLHLVEVLRDGKGEYVTIRFHGELPETLVFRRKAIEGATEAVMRENGIAKRGSDDALGVWNTSVAKSR